MVTGQHDALVPWPREIGSLSNQQNRPGRLAEEINLSRPPGIRTPDRPFRSVVAIPTPRHYNHGTTVFWERVLCNMTDRFINKVLGKAVPLQAWSAPEVSRKFRFPDFMTTAQDDGKVASITHRPPLPPGKTPGTHFC